MIVRYNSFISHFSRLCNKAIRVRVDRPTIGGAQHLSGLVVSTVPSAPHRDVSRSANFSSGAGDLSLPWYRDRPPLVATPREQVTHGRVACAALKLGDISGARVSSRRSRSASVGGRRIYGLRFDRSPHAASLSTRWAEMPAILATRPRCSLRAVNALSALNLLPDRGLSVSRSPCGVRGRDRSPL